MAKVTGIVPRKLQNFKIPLPTIARVEHFAAKHGLSKSQVVIDQLNKLPPARGKLPKPKKAAKKAAPKVKAKKAVKKAVKASSLVTSPLANKTAKVKKSRKARAVSTADSLFSGKPAVAVTRPLETPMVMEPQVTEPKMEHVPAPVPELPPQVTETVVAASPELEIVETREADGEVVATTYSFATELAQTAIPVPPPAPPAPEPAVEHVEQPKQAEDVAKSSEPAPAWPSEVSKEDLADLDKLLGA